MAEPPQLGLAESKSSLMGEWIDDPEDPSRRGVEDEQVPPPSPGRPPLPPQQPLECALSSSFSPYSSPKEGSRHRRSTSDVSDVSFDGKTEASSRKSLAWESKNVSEAIQHSSVRAPKSPSRSSILTFADINDDQNPIEDEAETLILKAIEETKEYVRAGPSILEGVPVEAFSEADALCVEITDSGLNRFKAATDKAREESAGVEERLAGITTAMRVLQEEGAVILHERDAGNQSHGTRGNQSHDTHTGIPEQPPEEDMPQSNADALAQHASLLFRRSSGLKDEQEKGHVDIEHGGSVSIDDSQHESNEKRKWFRKAPGQSQAINITRGVKTQVADFSNFVQPQRATLFTYVKAILGFVILPMTSIAAFLYYGTKNKRLKALDDATLSWFFLFLVRHTIVSALAKASEVVVIQYLSLRKRLYLRVFGPQLAIFVVQSKGWPCIVFFWALYGFLMLSGSHPFAKHWLFWQEVIGMCNASNNAGNVTDSRFNYCTLGCALGFAVLTTVKRVILGLHLGKQTYNSYGEKLASTMHNNLLVSEVATLSHRDQSATPPSQSPVDLSGVSAMGFTSGNDSASSSEDSSTTTPPAKIELTRGGERPTGSQYYAGHSTSYKQLVNNALGDWEEPEIVKKKPSDVSISAILEFKQCLTFVDNHFLFSVAFGPTDKRKACIESAQRVYDRLLVRQGEGDTLHFGVLAELAVNRDGSVDKDKLKELVRVFRPDRDGILSKVHFLISVDKVYKEFRMLQASIENSGTVYRSFEIMVNVAFFAILWCIVLFVFGIDPFTLFISAAAFFAGISFIIGKAGAQYFQGLLFILVQRPYDIGDRIAVSNPQYDTNTNGSTTWFVEELGLFSTTVRLAATNEVATYSNGSLASLRIINAARSPLAVVSIPLKFGVGVSYSKIQLFKKTVEKFVRDRPREWMSLLAFRAGTMEQDQGYIQYSISLQHRESWQNVGAILTSKADVSSFSLEAAKQLGMNYTAPPLPVNLSMAAPAALSGDDVSIENASRQTEMNAIAAMFEQAKSPK